MYESDHGGEKLIDHSILLVPLHNNKDLHLLGSGSIMLVRKKPSLGSGDGAVDKGANSRLGNGGMGTVKCIPYKKTSNNSLFRSGSKLLVHRAPIMVGLSTNAKVMTTFQRPMTGRRAYSKHAEAALQQCSLGPKRRMDGMSKLLARAGRGLSFKLPTTQLKKASSDTEEESDDEDVKKTDVPFDPLLVWKSPHNGGTAKGLPSQT
jgi:hypothetical protein